MRELIIRWIIGCVALALVAHMNIGIAYTSVGSLVLATLVIGFVNSVIRPILQLITLPLSCLTFGLFGMFLNLALFYSVGRIVPGFKVEFPMGAILGPFLISIISAVLNLLLIPAKED
jgi:putative membrane protein